MIKVCDLCFCEVLTSWQDVVRSRTKHEIDKDYCHPCSMKVYNTGAKNSSKKQEIKKKISQATKGKSKKFRDGRNLRRLPFKKAVNGYILAWSEKENKHVPYHRTVVADHNQVPLSDLDIVHHIDGNKLNNNPNNLVVVHGVSEHQQLHSQLEKVAMSLVQTGTIRFNPNTKQYYVEPDLDLANLPLSLGFENVAIQQKKNICTSRLDAQIESEIIRGVMRPIPLIAANMSTVINPFFYKELYRLGAFGVLHRAAPQDTIIKDIQEVAKECEWVAASLGIEKDQLDFAKKMIASGCNVLVIDVAHGYNDIVIDLAKKLKLFAPSVKVVIGNTTNIDCLLETYEFVDALKVGIANGLACETKNTAGCNEKQFSSIFKFKELSKQFGIPIISDGGIREPADFTKAIGAGANSVMAGSIFASCPESAAPLVSINGTEKKLYAGMASEYVQNLWKGGLKSGTVAEGGVRYLEVGESIEKLLNKYSGALRSGITYSGANSIATFQKNVKFVRHV